MYQKNSNYSCNNCFLQKTEEKTIEEELVKLEKIVIAYEQQIERMATKLAALKRENKIHE